jgi:hypothetical protein
MGRGNGRGNEFHPYNSNTQTPMLIAKGSRSSRLKASTHYPLS